MKISIFEFLKNDETWLQHVRKFKHWHHHRDANNLSIWKEIDPLESKLGVQFPYSDMTNIQSGADIGSIEKDMCENAQIYILEIPYCSGSDYSSSLVEQSNFKFLEKEYENLEGLYLFYGGYNTFSIGIDLREFVDEDFISILNGLEDYSLIDDDFYSNLQIEQETKDWNNYGKDDFIRKLENEFSDFLELNEDKIEYIYGAIWDISDLSDDTIWEFYRNQCEKHNAYPHDETGGSFYFPFDFVEKIEESEMVELLDLNNSLYDAFERREEKKLESILEAIHRLETSPTTENRELKLSILRNILNTLQDNTAENFQNLINVLGV